jgi:hypothetical protein
MNDWLNELPFAWLLIAVLALSYIAVTAVYTRVMMLVIDRRRRVPDQKPSRDTISVEEASHGITRVNEASAGIPIAAAAVAGPDDSPKTEAGWHRLTWEDIAGVKRALAARRANELARHAEELKKLDAEQAEIDAIDMAINSFAQRYGRDAPDALSSGCGSPPLDSLLALAASAGREANRQS